MREAVIVAMGRSAVGKAPKGVFKNTRPESIASQVIKGMLDKEDSEIKNQIEEVIFGCAFPEAEQGLNVARNISLLSGITNEASAQTVNRFCASGLQAIATGANSIKCGENSVVLAGGIESMSVVPMGGNLSLGHPELIEKEPGAYVSMGITAENVAKRYGISREEQDEFSYNSHIKALKAQQAGKFERQIIPVYADSVEVIDGKPQKVSRLITQDQGIRPTISVEALGKLRPVFKAGGSVTAGNASQMSDGSGVVLLMEKEEALEKGLKPLA
ncbi:MAG: thiolase family protein, partial [Vagococcus sp.]|uniref:thiolase family protein n=1 Tax=Vagococcus sp. TaxID=1933889 RepID=UPI002FCAEE40